MFTPCNISLQSIVNQRLKSYYENHIWIYAILQIEKFNGQFHCIIALKNEFEFRSPGDTYELKKVAIE